MMSECSHKNFDAEVVINRLEDMGRFQADIRIQCSECGVPFGFVGLPWGVDLNGAAMSPDGEEARLTIRPVSTERRET